MHFILTSSPHKSDTNVKSSLHVHAHIQTDFTFRVALKMPQVLPSPKMAINVKGTGEALNWHSRLTAFYEGWSFGAGWFITMRMTVKPFTSAAYEELQPGNTSTTDGSKVATWRRRGVKQVPTRSPRFTGPESVTLAGTLLCTDSFPAILLGLR